MEYVFEIVFILKSMKLSRDNVVNSPFAASNTLTTFTKSIFFFSPGYNNGGSFGPVYDSCL